MPDSALMPDSAVSLPEAAQLKARLGAAASHGKGRCQASTEASWKSLLPCDAVEPRLASHRTASVQAVHSMHSSLHCMHTFA